MNPDTWLKNNTFHHSEFEDLKALVKEKKKKGRKYHYAYLPLMRKKQ